MKEYEGNIVQRNVQRGVDITRPIDIVTLGAGVIFSSGALLAAGGIGLVGGEIAKKIATPRKKSE